MGDFPGRAAVQAFQGRLFAGLILIAVAFLVLLWRLYSLQILRGEELTSKGRRNYVQRVEVQHDRGIIYDRHGRILVDNRPSLAVQVTPHFLGDRGNQERVLTALGNQLGLDPEILQNIRDTIASRRGLDRFVPVLVKRDLTPTEVEVIESQKSIFALDGVDIVEGRRRTYPGKRLGAHLLGYVNEIDPGRLARERNRGNPDDYARGDLVGRAGVEHHFETRLRGGDGRTHVVVDAKGRRQRSDYFEQLAGSPSDVPPRPGHNLVLTIDAELQRQAESAFDGRAGAVVAMDPNTGAIRAMVSVPAYDPNRVSGLLALEEKARLDADPLKPWVNRAIQGQYAPGSTFKVVTAMAALSQNVSRPSERVTCPGFFRMGRHTWRCHRDAGHGAVNLRQAIKVSCDTYFYTMSGRTGIDPIAAAGRELGLGRRTGIELRGEKPGLMPDEAFHDRVDRATGGYQRGMAVNTSIGQGSVLMTPLQLAVAYSALANGGRVLKPQLVERIETPDFRVVRRRLDVSGARVEEVVGKAPETSWRMTPEVRRQLKASPEHLRAIHEGLIAVTSEPGGTAYWRRSRQVSMAGKTGTAQVIRLGKERLDADEVPYEERDHAWFAAWAPAEDPKLVVVVLNEHSGHGGSKAAPIAVRVIDAFFELEAGLASADRRGWP